MVSCYGGNDGSLELTVSGGVAPFTFNWTGGIGNTGNPTGLSTGSYNVTITDANGCSTSTGANVNQPQELSLSITPTNIGCNMTTGSATANVGGGTFPYSYAWSNGQTTQTATNLAAGTYEVIVTDANGCVISLTTTVDEITGLTVNIGSSNVSCHGGNDGGATANVSGGQAPFTYAWSNGQSSETITNLEPGNYSVTVMDFNGCSGESSITITEPLTGLNLNITGTGGSLSLIHI